MNDIAIRVENLSKRYMIGASQTRHDTLRDQIAANLRGRFGHNRKAVSPSNTFWALKDVSFEVKRGEVLGIIGRNGQTIQAIRALLASAAARHGERATLEIVE